MHDLTRNMSRAVFRVMTAIVLTATMALAESDEELAKKLANPVANLISVPLQNNWDFGIGPKDATRYTLNIQPVIPFSISNDLNLITRTIVPIISMEEPAPGVGDHAGLGDIVQSFFFSPKATTSGGWIWGAGPVILYPTGAETFSADKWGLGPTAVFLKQESGWTYGMLANHIWSISGGGSNNVSASFVNPFISFTTRTQTTYGLQTETTYDWERSQWTVPLAANVSQLLKIGGMPLSLAAGGRVYVEKPENGPEWGLRFAVTFLFPK